MKWLTWTVLLRQLHLYTLEKLSILWTKSILWRVITANNYGWVLYMSLLSCAHLCNGLNAIRFGLCNIKTWDVLFENQVEDFDFYITKKSEEWLISVLFRACNRWQGNTTLVQPNCVCNSSALYPIRLTSFYTERHSKV